MTARKLLVAVVLVLGCRLSAAESDAAPIAAPIPDADPHHEPEALGGAGPAEPVPSEPPSVDARAQAFAHRVIVLDGHVDVPWRLEKSAARDGALTEDVGAVAEAGDFDLPRAREGGLDAPFMSIYVSPDYEMKGADAEAEKLIGMVESIVAAHPEDFALAPTVASVRENFEAGRISLPMGMENGAPIMGKLANVARFHARGIRYITLAHSEDNHIADSSYAKTHTHGGLSAFGEKVVAEMNDVGIMVDVSHVSDGTFWDVMKVSKAPVIASHSSCRHFTPGWERNMSDEMIKALAEHGGVIQINFGSGFLDGEVRAGRKKHEAALKAHVRSKGLKLESEAGQAAAASYSAENPAPRATVAMVADHIEHVVELVGIEHVGLGSDFDGLGDSLPEGLRSVADFPHLFAELMRRGMSEDDLEKVASGNVLRVWSEVEAYAAAH